MDLNHIVLPSSLLADFYKNHLVENIAIHAPAAALPEKTNLKAGVQYLGSNQKRICLLVSYPKDVYLPDAQLNFLTSILQACKLNLGDVAIVNHYREKNISFVELSRQLTCSCLLIFGIEPAVIGLSEIPLFSVVQTGDCKIVYAPAAEHLNKNDTDSKLLKSRLWACLKQMFNV